jgi:hypothetical protein
MTYAVVISADDGPARAGRLELERDSVAYAGGRVPYADLRDIYLERTSNRPPQLVVLSRDGERLQISSLEGLGALHELAEHLVDAREHAV